RAAGADERADDGDARDRVRAGHERRGERRRHFRDDLEADEHGEDEDREARKIHQLSPAAWRVGAWTICPSCVTRGPLVSSSSRSSTMLASFVRCSTKLVMFFE